MERKSRTRGDIRGFKLSPIRRGGEYHPPSTEGRRPIGTLLSAKLNDVGMEGCKPALHLGPTDVGHEFTDQNREVTFKRSHIRHRVIRSIRIERFFKKREPIAPVLVNRRTRDSRSLRDRLDCRCAVSVRNDQVTHSGEHGLPLMRVPRATRTVCAGSDSLISHIFTLRLVKYLSTRISVGIDGLHFSNGPNWFGTAFTYRTLRLRRSPGFGNKDLARRAAVHRRAHAQDSVSRAQRHGRQRHPIGSGANRESAAYDAEPPLISATAPRQISISVSFL